jgi:dolichol-phosphate mannosyltransferase
MAKNIILSVVLPAYLEEENLRYLLPRLNGVLEKMDLRTEVLVIDTESEIDHTKDVCASNAVKYINRRGGNNYGDAVRTGIFEANGDWVLFMDADGSHTPEFIPELFKYSNQYDLIIASRYIDEGKTENNFLLILMSRVLNWTYSFILGIPCKDVSNSFKIYRGDNLKKLHLSCNNFDIVEEIIYKIYLNNRSIQIKEVPFVFKKRMFGETKRNLFIFMLTYLFTIIRLRFHS